MTGNVQIKVALDRYDNAEYFPGAGTLKRALWYWVNALVFASWWLPHSRLKCALLRLFGAKVGVGVVIKPRVNIKYPWHVELGDHVWIGEGAWLDSLGPIRIGSHVCISQGAYLCTGNHDYKDPAFGLIVEGITLDDGAWVGAKAVVCPGTSIGSNAVLTVASVGHGALTENGIYRGNPAKWVRARTLHPEAVR